MWVGLAGARYFALSLPTAAAAAAASEAPVARAGSFPRLRGVLGVAAWPAEAVARLAGAAVAPLARPPCSPLRLRQPSATRLVPAPGLPPVSAASRGPCSCEETPR